MHMISIYSLICSNIQQFHQYINIRCFILDNAAHEFLICCNSCCDDTKKLHTGDKVRELNGDVTLSSVIVLDVRRLANEKIRIVRESNTTVVLHDLN